jgi:hypothetical protein
MPMNEYNCILSFVQVLRAELPLRGAFSSFSKCGQSLLPVENRLWVGREREPGEITLRGTVAQ